MPMEIKINMDEKSGKITDILNFRRRPERSDAMESGLALREEYAWAE